MNRYEDPIRNYIRQRRRERRVRALLAFAGACLATATMLGIVLAMR